MMQQGQLSFIETVVRHDAPPAGIDCTNLSQGLVVRTEIHACMHACMQKHVHRQTHMFLHRYVVSYRFLTNK